MRTILITTCALLAAINSQAGILQEQEPNDTPDQATLAVFPVELIGNLAPADQDAFRFEIDDIDANATWRFTFTGDVSQSQSVTVYRDADGKVGEVLDLNKIIGTTRIETPGVLFEQGKYILGVSGAGGYEVKVERVDVLRPRPNLGDTVSELTRFAMRLDPPGDEQLPVSAIADGLTSVHVQSFPKSGCRVALLTPLGEVAQRATCDKYGRATLAGLMLTEQDYLLRLENFTVGRLWTSNAGPVHSGVEVEPNFDRKHASFLQPYLPTAGYVSKGDRDNFRFTAGEAPLTLSIQGT